jgi:hypothetical protein
MSVTTTYAPVVLERASQAFVEATANPPFLRRRGAADSAPRLDGNETERLK